MIERFDHAVIGVPDLESAMDAFRRLGFEVAVGGRHPLLGTRNAIVRFGLDYLELLTVEHPDTARSRGAFGADLLSFLEHDSGLVGFVLAGTGLEDEVSGLRGLGIGVEGPFEMDRIHARGGRLKWRLVVPGFSPWRKPWPYLIDWITAENELLAWDPPGGHACAVDSVAAIDLAVEDLDEGIAVYEQAFGMQPRDGRPLPGAASRHYRRSGFRLGIHQPVGAGAVASELEQRGPGPFRLILSSADIAGTARTLARNRVPYKESRGGIDIDPEAAAGARLRITAP
ncbi:MAG: VOC family protein [bacterium]|nr:VOC family protein [bacterium]